MRYGAMALFKKSNPDVTALKAELRDLRKFKQDAEKRGAAKSKVKLFLMKIWAGPELSKSLEAWMTAKEENDSSQTIHATANLIAAMFRRFFRVGLVLLLLAIIPMLLILLQIFVMERQNQSLIKQIEAQRDASSSQQVTEYLKLLLSSDEKEITAAEGLLASDLVNRDISIERLAALVRSGNADVECSALRALSRIVESSTNLTLADAISPDSEDRVRLSDLQCSSLDLSGVNFGPITFVEVGFPNANFKSADLSEAEFQLSNLRHSDLSEAYLCRGDNNCVSFIEDTDLSYSKLTFTNRSKDVFRGGLILRGAQLQFGQDIIETKQGLLGTNQIKATTTAVPKFSRDNIISTGVCYESSFSQCYLFHKARDLGQLNDQKLNTLRQSNCPLNLDGPIVLTSITPCEKLGLQAPW